MKTIEVDFEISGRAKIQVTDEVYEEMVESGESFFQADEIGVCVDELIGLRGTIDNVEIDWSSGPPVEPKA